VAQTALLHINPYIIYIFIYGPWETFPHAHGDTLTTLAVAATTARTDAETEAPTASVTADGSASLGLEAYCALL